MHEIDAIEKDAKLKKKQRSLSVCEVSSSSTDILWPIQHQQLDSNKCPSAKSAIKKAKRRKRSRSVHFTTNDSLHNSRIQSTSTTGEYLPDPLANTTNSFPSVQRLSEDDAENDDAKMFEFEPDNLADPSNGGLYNVFGVSEL